MAWVSAAMPGGDPQAWDRALLALRRELDAPPDLCFLFVAGAHPEDPRRGLECVRERLAPTQVIGCGASGVLGGGRELERAPALALVAGHLEGARIRSHYFAPAALRTGALPSFVAGTSGVVFADPYTCDSELLLAELGRAAPGAPIVGGLASGARHKGAGVLFADGAAQQGGSVVLEVEGGGWTLDTVVAQGCRPIAQPLFVTAVEEGWIRELDGRPALAVLRDIARDASSKDRDLMRHSLFLGIEMHPMRSSYGHGDFLVRNLVGADPERDALAVAAAIEVGQVVQFQLRDAGASTSDLDDRLAKYTGECEGDPEAALLFSCVGRGEGLYGEADHDSHAFLRRVGGLPLGGFFCNGEIGPVGGRAFLHAYTSAFGIFRRIALR